MLEPSVVFACTQFDRGELDPTKRQDVLGQLAGEGHKRLEAFLFEPYLIEALRTCCNPGELSTGWVFHFDHEQKPKYWFRLLSSSEPTINLCDKKTTQFLYGAGCTVSVVKFDTAENKFKASMYDGSWSKPDELPEIMKVIAGINKPLQSPKNYNVINRVAQKPVLEYMENHLTDQALFDLSVSRVFMNCYLWPWFAKQPMDLDAICLVENTIRFIEFKRKYPSRIMTFGIDNGHGKLAIWLRQNKHSLTHLILCDPLWDQHTSPLHLLEENSSTVNCAYWLGIELAEAHTQGAKLHTTGAGSGFGGGDRDQHSLPLRYFKLIGRGLTPQFICEYLSDSTLSVTAEMLREAHIHAQELRGQS